MISLSTLPQYRTDAGTDGTGESGTLLKRVWLHVPGSGNCTPSNKAHVGRLCHLFIKINI